MVPMLGLSALLTNLRLVNLDGNSSSGRAYIVRKAKSDWKGQSMGAILEFQSHSVFEEFS